MLLASPVGFGYFVGSDVTPSTPFGVTLTASGTTHTMGSWSSLIAPTQDLYYLWVMFGNGNTSAASVQNLVDLGIGPDSSNVTVIAEYLCAGSAAGGQAGRRAYMAPLFIPAETTLWGRTQSSVASKTIQANVWGWGGPDRPASFPVIHAWIAEGEDAGSSIGVTVTPGASGAQGSYTQIVASSAYDYAGLMMGHACTDTTMNNAYLTGGLGIGAATEQDIGTSYFAITQSTEQIGHDSLAMLADIPAGTRIAARMSASGAADSGISVIAYGLRA